MTFKQNITITKDYLFVRAEGKKNFKLMKEEYNKIAEYCSSTSIGKVLIDATRLSGNLEVNDHLELGQSIPAQLNNKPIKMAIVKLKDNANNFTEKVAQYRGANIQTFINIEEAYDWINE